MNNHQELTLSQSVWTQPERDVTNDLQTDTDRGLTEVEARKRLAGFGQNKLREYRKKSIWVILLHQFKSLIIGLLMLAAAASFFFGEYLDGWAILAVILISVFIGFFTELRAIRSMEALYRIGRVRTRVLRDGGVQEVDASLIVPGDIVLVEGGDVITADLRILESAGLQVDESALTGESLSVEKGTGPLPQETILAERKNMLYKGTAVTSGSGTGVVVATGMETELGTISSLVQETDDEKTPLEARLDKLGNRLIGVTLFITAFITLAGIQSGKNLILMIQTGIALAVAAIPEGLPIVATIALARGIKTMADRNALITRLSSVETLGSTQVIFTDKTGTLTENRMSVTEYLLPGQHIKVGSGDDKPFCLPEEDEQVNPNSSPVLRLALETGVFCNNASLQGGNNDRGSGDPLEVALLATGRRGGFSQKNLLEKYPEIREEAFDAEIKMMATCNQIDSDGYRISVKGAPGAVLDSCEFIAEGDDFVPFQEKEKEKWKKRNEEMASRGLRVLALAYKQTDNSEEPPYERLIFLGLVALLDPPRRDVKESIESCRKAGIRVVMVTGDQVETARYIARETGLESDPDAGIIHGKDLGSEDHPVSSPNVAQNLFKTSVFARINPKQKLDLIERFQTSGYVVAMTGDGVNDAPALKKADIGIAMGKRGSQVAREASDMILTDDAFSSIVTAIEQGRIIFGNIRRFIFYLMSCNVSEVMVIGLAFVFGTALPILPLQILFLNLVTDVFPALALGVGKGEKGMMLEPPREREEAILTQNHWLAIGAYGVLLSVTVLGALIMGVDVLQLPVEEAVTLSFLTLALAQLWHVFNMRSNQSGIFINSVTKNPYVWGALVLSVVLIMSVVFVPSLSRVLSIHPPDLNGWLIVLGMSLIPLIVGQSIQSVYQVFTGRKDNIRIQ